MLGGVEQSLPEQAIAKHLRGQCAPDLPSVGCAGDVLVVHCLQGVADRQRQNAANRVIPQGFDQPENIAAGDTEARGIMHQHPVIGFCPILEMQQGGIDGIRSLAAPGHCSDTRMIGKGQVGPVAILLAQCDIDAGDGFHRQQSFQSVLKHRLAADFKILLGYFGAHALADAGRRDNRPEGEAHEAFLIAEYSL